MLLFFISPTWCVNGLLPDVATNIYSESFLEVSRSRRLGAAVQRASEFCVNFLTGGEARRWRRFEGG